MPDWGAMVAAMADFIRQSDEESRVVDPGAAGGAVVEQLPASGSGTEASSESLPEVVTPAGTPSAESSAGSSQTAMASPAGAQAAAPNGNAETAPAPYRPPAFGAVSGLTMDAVRGMSPSEINRRWDEVSALLRREGGR